MVSYVMQMRYSSTSSADDTTNDKVKNQMKDGRSSSADDTTDDKVKNQMKDGRCAADWKEEVLK